ncbi:MAG TPA: LanC-like protein [Solirubrobacteraceae bacterium]|nr:LanC-like protein [Solirubrobacteraceae bacterium]
MLWRVEEHETLTEREWDPAVASAAIAAIVADAEEAERDGGWPGHPLDDLDETRVLSSVYLGGAGMIWALSKLGSSIDCGAAVACALERYRVAPDPEEALHPPSLFTGETGMLAVANRLGSTAADLSRLRELIRANREWLTWELLYGSPGTILAARACGLSEEWRESAELLYKRWDESSNMWTGEFAGDVQNYLGPAHGFAGNVHALRGFVDEDILRERAATLLSRTAGREDGLVNWPPRDRPLSQQAAKMRVQWCHGAPGIVTTLGDLMPLDLAIGGGELTWRAGPLSKGPGLCHGTAGNGYAFLRLHDLTGDPVWLERARRFAMHAIAQVERERAAHGRGRYTLLTGDIGTALYLGACVDADPDFPILDTF